MLEVSLNSDTCVALHNLQIGKKLYSLDMLGLTIMIPVIFAVDGCRNVELMMYLLPMGVCLILASNTEQSGFIIDN